MKKSSIARGVGFVAALGASAALVGAAVSTTGAYFTDSHDGAINSGTGHVKVDTTDTNLNFANLLPGDYQTQRVDYTARGTGSQDLWLVLPTDGSAEALLGQHGDGLGRYGHFKVTSTGGANFVSNNLHDKGTSTDSCAIDANGWGGSNQEATSTNNADNGSYVPYCAPKTAILLQSDMNPGDTGSMTVEFGFTKILKSGQDAPLTKTAAYKIVATQHGVRPDNVNNPS